MDLDQSMVGLIRNLNLLSKWLGVRLWLFCMEKFWFVTVGKLTVDSTRFNLSEEEIEKKTSKKV
jgi:hypothetical protein